MYRSSTIYNAAFYYFHNIFISDLNIYLYLIYYCFIFFFKCLFLCMSFFFFSSRRRHTRSDRDWSSDVCSSDLMPDEDTHPFFPDHFWPYPIIAVVMLIAVGVLSAFVQKNLQLEPAADPRAVTIPRPDWYFLFLFQFLKLGPELIMSQVIPGIVVGALILFPFIDGIAGPRMARRLGWKSWPGPGRNIIT